MLISGVVLVAFVLRTAITSISPLLPEISADLGLGAVSLSILGALPAAAFSIFSLMTPGLARRIAPEILLAAGMLVAAAFQLFRAITGSSAFFLAASFVILAALGVANTLLPSLIKKYYPTQVRKVTSAYIFALTLGTAVSPQLAAPLAEAGDWRFSIGIWALANLVAAVPWLIVILTRRDRIDNQSGVNSLRVTKMEAVSSRGLRYGLALMYGCTVAHVYTSLTWLPVYLVSVGMPPTESGSLLSLYALAGLPLAILLPMTVARMRNPFPVVALWNIVFLGGYAGLLLSSQQGAWIWIIVLGLAPAAFPLSMALITSRTFSPQETAYVSGFSQGIGFAIAGVCPFIFGLTVEAAGWGWAFGFLCALLPLQMVGAYFACRPRIPQSRVAAASLLPETDPLISSSQGANR